MKTPTVTSSKILNHPYWFPSPPTPLEKEPLAELASQVIQRVENLPASPQRQVQSQSGKIPWRGEWQPTPVFSP